MNPTGFLQLLSYLLMAEGSEQNALAKAKHQKCSDARVCAALGDFRETTRVLKTAVSSGTTLDSTWAAPLLALQSLQSEWFQSLASVSMLDALLREAPRVPPNQHFAVTSFVGNATGGLAEGAWAPLMELGFAAGSIALQKAIAGLVVTDEINRFQSAQAQSVVEAGLRTAVGVAADKKVITALLNAISPIGSSGDARADLQMALAAVPLGQFSKPMVFTSPQIMKQIAMLGGVNGFEFPDVAIPGGGSIAGMPATGIDACHNYLSLGDILIVVDAAQVGCDAGALELLVSRDASILMTDDASGTSPANLVSMFQTNSLAVRANRFFNIGKVRDSAAAVISHVGYLGSP